jgi:hypothetical protein
MARKTTAIGPKTASRKKTDDAVGLPTIAGGDAEKRPNAPNLRSLARAHAAAAVEALAAVMRDSSATPAARVSAAGALLAWGYGKASPAEEGRRTAKPAEQIVRLVWGGDDA